MTADRSPRTYSPTSEADVGSDGAETGSQADSAARLRAGDRIGESGQYTLKRALGASQARWLADSSLGPCHVRLCEPAEWSTLSRERRARERRSISREASRWRSVTAARPRLRDVFWEGDTLCWVEAPTRGAALSTLEGSLTLYEGMSLIEECLCALDVLHGERDFQLGDPLLHLNVTPQTIW